MLRRRHISEAPWSALPLSRAFHEPIIDRDLLDAVQIKLTSQAQARRQARAGSDALLIGRIFDDRGNRMTLASAHKAGCPVSLLCLSAAHARPARGSRIGAARASELEQLMIASLQPEVAPPETQDDPAAVDRVRVLQHVWRVEVRSGSVLIELALPPEEQTGGI